MPGELLGRHVPLPVEIGGEDSSELQLRGMADELSTEYIANYCETDDLESVRCLKIHVDSVAQSVESLGIMLPSLLQLNLNGSHIPSVRELGTSLYCVQVLWLGQCGLQDISGIASMPHLREFYLPFNCVADLYPLSGNDALEVLDLEGNAIADIDEVKCLWSCNELACLTLQGNPLCKDLMYSREAICTALPQLQVLDDERIGCSPTSCPEDFGVPFLMDGWDGRLEAVEAIDLLRTCSGCQSMDTDANLSGLESSSEQVQPLQASHHLLAMGLKQVAGKSISEIFAAEPDENELLLERLRQAPTRQRSTPMGLTALRRGSSPFRPPERPQSHSSAQPRQAPSASQPAPVVLDSFLSTPDGAASELTCGGPLGGSPLSVARQRRLQAAAAPGSRGHLGIRALLQGSLTRHEEGTCSQGNPTPAGARPGAPDVRVHRPPTPGELRPQPNSPVQGSIEQSLRALLRPNPGQTAGAACEGDIEAGHKRGKVPRAPDAPKEEGECWPQQKGGKKAEAGRFPSGGAATAGMAKPRVLATVGHSVRLTTPQPCTTLRGQLPASPGVPPPAGRSRSTGAVPLSGSTALGLLGHYYPGPLDITCTVPWDSMRSPSAGPSGSGCHRVGGEALHVTPLEGGTKFNSTRQSNGLFHREALTPCCLLAY